MLTAQNIAVIAEDKPKATQTLESTSIEEQALPADVQRTGIERDEDPAPYRSIAEPNQKFECGLH